MSLLLTGEETERLLFRKIEKSDFDTWLPFHQNPLSTKYWEGLPQDPITACKEWFDKIFHRYENHLGGMNALIDKKSGAFIGQCGLLIQTVDNNRELEIGYSILPEYWKKGYATEAAVECRNYAFKCDLAKSLISIIHINNIPSKKVALNNGMHLDRITSYKGNPVEIYRINKE